MLKLDAVVHRSIPVNNLEEAEKFYGAILGLEHVGRLAHSPMSCFKLGDHQYHSLPAQRSPDSNRRAGRPFASRLRRRYRNVQRSLQAVSSSRHQDSRAGDINDFNLFSRGGMSASAGLETLKICFDQLCAEGADTGRIMNLGLHPHVMGQAHRIGALREFVEFAKSRADVWFPSREEIASWYLQIHENHIPTSNSAKA